MKARTLGVALATVIIASAGAATAQSLRVDRVDIVDKGIYEVTTGEITPNASTPAGTIAAVTIAKNIDATTAIRARDTPSPMAPACRSERRRRMPTCAGPRFR